MSKPITAQEARDLAASSKGAADAKREAKAGPAVDAAMAAIQTAAEDGAYDVSEPGTLSVSWSNP